MKYGSSTFPQLGRFSRSRRRDRPTTFSSHCWCLAVYGTYEIIKIVTIMSHINKVGQLFPPKIPSLNWLNQQNLSKHFSKIYHQIWWFTKCVTKFGDKLVTKFGDKLVTKFVTKFAPKFITKFGDSLNLSRNLVINWSPNSVIHRIKWQIWWQIRHQIWW